MNSNETKHTPTPWMHLSGGNVTTDAGPHWAAHVVAECDKESDAHFIAQACNGYDKLQRDNATMLEALKQIGAHISETVMFYSKGDHGDRVYVADVIRAAIAQAENAS